jgi:hypothetical protein
MFYRVFPYLIFFDACRRHKCGKAVGNDGMVYGGVYIWGH